MTIKDKIIKSFAAAIKMKFKKSLKQIILFGSRARGDFSRESDYDFILVFNNISAMTKNYISDLAAEFLLKRGAVITDIVLTEKDFNKMRFEPFIRNAQKEGIVL